MVKGLIYALVVGGLALAAGALKAEAQATIGEHARVTPEARVETEPVPHDGDAADDPAIWIHPSDPAKSLVLGTDKQGGLFVYDLDGQAIQEVSDESHPNNVDVIYGFELEGGAVDLAVASVRAEGRRGVKVWKINPETRRLSDVTRRKVISVFGGDEPYGICTYRSAKTGRFYFFVNEKGGKIEQHELRADDEGKVGSKKVRTLELDSLPEGCVADDEHGSFFVGEEKVGVWRFDAEPDADEEGKLIARVGQHGLTDDVEGLAIYRAAHGKGYLIVSSQGDNTFKVYERDGEHRFVGTIDPKRGKIDDVNDTDGIAVSNVGTSERFPKGIFVVQDGSNSGGRQNFKLYGWEDIAEERLLIDTDYSPRRSEGRR